MEAREPPGRARGVQTLDRAIDVLRLLAQHQLAGMSLASIVAETGLDRTTAYRITSSLVTSGMASRDLHKRYRLGVETMALGMASMYRPPLVERCTPMMKMLARQATGHVLLSVQSGDYSHCLHMESPSARILELESYVGKVRVLGTGISGVALLAILPDRQIHQHYARHCAEYQQHRVTESKLLRMVNQTRAAGFAYITSGDVAGVGIGFEAGSCGLAGLNFVALASELSSTRAAEIADLMRTQLCHYLR
ncbi:hypothetical protein GQ57_36535 [Burkholderia sp. MSh2]|nr:hypothetical protein GQ57_36535 [Burkholderia sp. MSh2]